MGIAISHRPPSLIMAYGPPDLAQIATAAKVSFSWPNANALAAFSGLSGVPFLGDLCAVAARRFAGSRFDQRLPSVVPGKRRPVGGALF